MYIGNVGDAAENDKVGDNDNEEVVDDDNVDGDNAENDDAAVVDASDGAKVGNGVNGNNGVGRHWMMSRFRW